MNSLKDETDVLSFKDMNYIFEQVDIINEEIINYFESFSIEKINKINFEKEKILYLEDVDYIENILKYFALCLEKTSNYDYKQWINNEKIIDRNIDYKDYNRWIINLNGFSNIIESEKKKDNFRFFYNSKTQDFNYDEWLDLEWSEY